MPSPAPAPMRAWKASLAALALTIAVLLLPSTALAAPGWTAPQALPQSMAAGPVTVSPKVEVDRAGNAHAAWVEGTFPSFTVKVATKPVGGGWSAPTALIAEATPGSPLQGNYPALTVAPDGAATVVWQDANAISSTGIWAATRPAGGSWGTPVNVSQTESAPTSFGSAGPRTVTDRAGNTTAVWQTGANVRAATRLAGGSWGDPADVYVGDTPTDTNFLFGLAADVSPSGAVTVAFRVGKTSNFGIYAKTRPTVNGDWSSLQEILGRGNTVNDIQLAVSGAGNSLNEATVLWRDNTNVVKASSRAPTNQGDSGNTWSTPADVGSGTVPKVRYDRHGNAVAVWQGSADVQTMRRTAGAWSAAAALPGAESGSAPQLAIGPNAEVHVAWLASDGTAPVVNGARYSGGAWSASVVLSDAGVAASAPALATGPTGDVEAIWAADALRGSTYQDVPALGVDWTANGLPGSFDLRSWIRYIGGAQAVEASNGASRPDINDPYSYRVTQSDAWIQRETGETVVASSGQVRFSMPVHFIDNRIANPRFRIAADGQSGRVVADGQGSGDMAEAMNGNWQVDPYQDVHLLDLDVAAATKVVSADGERTTWVGVPAKIAADGARYLSYAAGTRYGFFTITAPTSLETRSYPLVGDPGPGTNPGPGPDVTKPAPTKKPEPKLLRATGEVTKTGRKGSTTVRLSKRPGAKANKTYRVKLARKGKTIATGTVRGKTLKLSIRKTGKGKKARYPKLKGKYTLTGAKGVTKTQLTVGKPA